MKNELMIGDWVYNTQNDKPEQVCEIGSGLVMLSYNDLYEYDEIRPIPLTAEILEQNGFELLRDTWYFSQNGRPVLIRFADNYIVIIINGDHVPMKLRYVHELQHAMRLCGIDKEIIM